jgi:Zn-dependent protease with chaperone function
MLDGLVRRLIEWRYERAVRQFYLGTSLKVSERQLPELWASHTAAVRILDLERVPDLYVTTPVPGTAIAVGVKDPMVVIDSGLLGRLGPGEQRVVVAHELGHILSDHMVYMTALNILLAAGSAVPFVFGLPFRAVKTVLLEWYRAAELTCDRAATITVRDPQIVCRTLMVVASGMPPDKLDLDAFMAQAMEYENWDDPSDKVRRFFAEIGQTHPYAVRRVSEVMKWVQSGEYDRIIRGEYRTRDEPVDVRAEAGDAFEFYAERFRSIFKEFGENVSSLGNQIGGMAEGLADWVRNRGSDSSDDK